MTSKTGGPGHVIFWFDLFRSWLLWWRVAYNYSVSVRLFWPRVNIVMCLHTSCCLASVFSHIWWFNLITARHENGAASWKFNIACTLQECKNDCIFSNLWVQVDDGVTLRLSVSLCCHVLRTSSEDWIFINNFISSLVPIPNQRSLLP